MAKLNDMVDSIAQEYGLDPRLVMAFIQVESAARTWACRFEPHWPYFKDVSKWASALGQTEETEKMQQATSWGPMQVMGAVARELGFKGFLSQLSITEVGIRCGCMKLQALFKKYDNQDDVIAAYNQGDNRKGDNGRYKNQTYVDKIKLALTTVKDN